MKTYRFELFDANGDNPRARWLSPGGQVLERHLDRREVETLLTGVEGGYRSHAPMLSALGDALYRWLDGPTERWLQGARDQQVALLLYIDGGERLRGLPWELLFDQGFLTVQPARPVVPVRSASTRDEGPKVAANRPLRVLFMASSPLEVEPVLDFEGEEGAILTAAAGKVEVVVEESGSLAGLAERLSWFGPNYFDVLHLSGHAYIGRDGPRFVMEDEDGRRSDTSADDIAAAAEGVWPRLVFVSGCHTGGAVSDGLTGSMAEAIVDAGAPAVLGWALPVGDIAASSLAAELYQRLGAGADVPSAVTGARRALFDNRNGYWHLLRLYADHSELTSMVTTLGTPKRVKLRIRASSSLFLDAQGQVKVADRASFVGRRRELQTLLRRLRPADPTEGPQLALLHGMGGLGKSSLAARLLERLRPTHARQAVWVGKLDTLSLRDLAERLGLDSQTDQQVNELLNKDTSLANRLRFILDEPLADLACVFVFDDFEANLEPDGNGGHRPSPEALDILTSFSAAIQQTGSASRILVTSRYDFALPAPVDLVRQPISGLQGADLEKKLRLTTNLGPTASTDVDLRQRAVTASAGIPRLLERLDSLLDTDPGDLPAAIASIEATQVEYRENLLLEQLLDAQSSSTRRAIALASVYEIAVPAEAITALTPEPSITAAVASATGVGLLQAGPHPHTGETRYLISPLLRPLLDTMPERLDRDELKEKQALAAHFLYQLWVEPDDE